MKTRKYHRNRIVVGEVDLFGQFDLVTEDGYDLGKPEPTVDYASLSGGGFSDLTDWPGFTPYTAREMTFNLFRVCTDYKEWQRVKTDIYRLLAGHLLSFTCGADPGYTYTGRWVPDGDTWSHPIGTMRFKVHADPWKSAGIQAWHFNGAGGVDVVLPCGGKPTCPTIEVRRKTLVSFRERSWTLDAGAWRLADLWLLPGNNTLTVNTRPDYSIQVWRQIKDKTWAEISEMRWSDVAAAFKTIQDSPAWKTIKDKTWADIADMRWIELMHDASSSPEDEVIISYEVKEL